MDEYDKGIGEHYWHRMNVRRFPDHIRQILSAFDSACCSFLDGEKLRPEVDQFHLRLLCLEFQEKVFDAGLARQYEN